MQLFYNALLTHDHTQCSFSPEERKHLVRVLRKTVGDRILLTNGKGVLFEAEIVLATPKQCEARIVSVKKTEPKPYRLHLAVAPTKANDRYAWFLEKATEIGIDEITPILCDHSERKTVHLERMERILQAAMKQSLQTYLPQLNPLMTYRAFVEQEISGFKGIAHCHNHEKRELQRSAVAAQPITLLIGPEGDFSEAEVALAQHNGFVPVSLGQNRLRTETAALMACATVALVNG